MNRLIIVGNGFDLAHGLKTSYNSFMLWYIKGCFTDAFNKTSYLDDLIQIELNPGMPHYTSINSVLTSVEDCYEQNKFGDLMENRWFITPPGSNAYGFNSAFKISVKSKLLTRLLKNFSFNRWVDIENEFYTELKTILKSNIKSQQKEKFLSDLNLSLKHLINNLEKYLNTLPKSDYIDGYMDILTSLISKEEVHNIELDGEVEPIDTLILNFNYTDTIKPYLERFHFNSSRQIPSVNFIHGRLNYVKNPLVFGFGDELDDDYVAIEHEKVKGYFEYIKSFWYFRTSNYRDLVTFIDSEPYQIYVWGHSCGLSDRTMLNMIFENAHCKSIKIFYHGDLKENNYTSITHEIARHFKNKTEMRNKIVSLDKSYPMPQA
jgi:hypothetical protein